MATNTSLPVDISDNLIEAVRSFPTEKHVDHCGTEFTVSPVDLYATCPQCGTRIKLRAFSAHPELADLFDAFFEWLNQPSAETLSKGRRDELREEEED
jgi:hypothetical protein